MSHAPFRPRGRGGRAFDVSTGIVENGDKEFGGRSGEARRKRDKKEKGNSGARKDKYTFYRLHADPGIYGTSRPRLGLGRSLPDNNGQISADRTCRSALTGLQER